MLGPLVVPTGYEDINNNNINLCPNIYLSYIPSLFPSDLFPCDENCVLVFVASLLGFFTYCGILLASESGDE